MNYYSKELQAIFKVEIFNLLPKIQHLIKLASDYNANEMYCQTVRACCEERSCMADKTKAQLCKFEDDLIILFNRKNWV